MGGYLTDGGEVQFLSAHILLWLKAIPSHHFAVNISYRMYIIVILDYYQL